MSERDRYEPGVPCWVDILRPDPEAAMAFYGPLLGWEFAGPGPGGYHVARLRGRDVAGIGTGTPAGARMDDVRRRGERRRGRRGGRARRRPRARGALRRRARGAPGRAGRPGGRAVRRLGGGRPAGRPARQRARRVGDQPACDPRRRRRRGVLRRAVRLDHRGVRHPRSACSGSRATSAASRSSPCRARWSRRWRPATARRRWTPDFWVDDVDATAARAAELGGTAVVAPFDTPVGRAAVLADPAGAAFSVSRVVP